MSFKTKINFLELRKVFSSLLSNQRTSLLFSVSAMKIIEATQIEMKNERRINFLTLSSLLFTPEMKNRFYRSCSFFLFLSCVHQKKKMKKKLTRKRKRDLRLTLSSMFSMKSRLSLWLSRARDEGALACMTNIILFNYSSDESFYVFSLFFFFLHSSFVNEIFPSLQIIFVNLANFTCVFSKRHQKLVWWCFTT